MRRAATFRLVRADDGSVVAEVTTVSPLETQRRPGSAAIERPAQYLQRATLNELVTGTDTQRARNILVRIYVPPAGPHLVERWLDLSQGSEERSLVEQLVAQDELPVRWVKEGVTTVIELPASRRRAWSEALQNTRELTREDWVRHVIDFGLEVSEWPEEALKRTAPLGPRIARAPVRPIPFFAARSGELPPSGQPVIAGLRLPTGHALPTLAPTKWLSDEPIPAAQDIASRLAAVFSQTGIWPLLWLGPFEPPSNELDWATVDTVDEIDPAVLLGTSLAASSPAPARAEDPFSRLPAGADLSARLLLVPCNRPADAITVMGGLGVEVSSAEISAVLRTWEERFGAVPIAAEPSHAWLAVHAPPTARDQALLLAAEYTAFCPLPDGPPLGELAARFVARTHAEPPGTLNSPGSPYPSLGFEVTPHLWVMGWYD